MIPSLLMYNLSEKVCAFSTERYNGYSKGLYASFNANEFCGDSIEAVSKNRLMLCNYLRINPSKLIIPHQTHGVKCICVGEKFLSKNNEERNKELEGVDALITNNSRVCITVSTADCIPILMYDTKNNVIAAVHAGWRGTLLRITRVVLNGMKKEYGTMPKNVVAAIGPGISLKAFEVGDEVYEAFADKGFSMMEIAKFNSNTNKWHIDLIRCNRNELEDSGVLSQQISESNICTFYSYKRFFSARRLGTKCGRILNGIFIK